MKFSISLFSFCILSFLLVLSCSTDEVQDTTPPPSIIQNPEPEPETEDETQAESENQTTDSAEEYFSVNYEGNGTFTRYGAPYPPMESYGVELIEGEVNDEGEYLKGSTLRFTYQNNPGWFLRNSYDRESFTEIPEMAVINDFDQFKWYEILEGEQFVINEDIYIPINVATTMDTFPYDQEESFGLFPKVGPNTDLYPEWNEPSNEYNWYVTNNFSWPGYVEAYKDRLFQITQVVGDFGPLDILIFDWEADPDHNREMFRETRQKAAISMYYNQEWAGASPDGTFLMNDYDRGVSNNGYPFGSADADLGSRKFVGEINKQSESNRGLQEVLTNWSNRLGITTEELMKREDFHWDWVGIHEPLHIWQSSHVTNGIYNEIEGDLYGGHPLLLKDISYLSKIGPRWFIEGQIIMMEEIFMEKLGLRIVQDMSNGYEDTEKKFDIRWKYKNNQFRWFKENGGPDRIQRHEFNEDYNFLAGIQQSNGESIQANGGVDNATPRRHYFSIGTLACYYMFKKMNYNFNDWLQLDVIRGGQGFDVAMEQYLGLTEQQFYDEFNTWFFDSGLTDDQKIEYLWPEGTDPIQIDIQSRR
tara:strand:+ start:2402 stop:4162 length:1761 start_codon:yes stop_codon:yes gene_type:complete